MSDKDDPFFRQLLRAQVRELLKTRADELSVDELQRILGVLAGTTPRESALVILNEGLREIAQAHPREVEFPYQPLEVFSVLQTATGRLSLEALHAAIDFHNTLVRPAARGKRRILSRAAAFRRLAVASGLAAPRQTADAVTKALRRAKGKLPASLK